MGEARRIVERIERPRPAPFDETLWPVTLALLALTGYLAYLVVLLGGVHDPLPWRNIAVLLATLGLTAAGLLIGLYWLPRRQHRRMQAATLASLLLHVAILHQLARVFLQLPPREFLIEVPPIARLLPEEAFRPRLPEPNRTREPEVWETLVAVAGPQRDGARSSDEPARRALDPLREPMEPVAIRGLVMEVPERPVAANATRRGDELDRRSRSNIQSPPEIPLLAESPAAAATSTATVKRTAPPSALPPRHVVDGETAASQVAVTSAAQPVRRFEDSPSDHRPRAPAERHAGSASPVVAAVPLETAPTPPSAEVPTLARARASTQEPALSLAAVSEMELDERPTLSIQEPYRQILDEREPRPWRERTARQSGKALPLMGAVVDVPDVPEPAEGPEASGQLRDQIARVPWKENVPTRDRSPSEDRTRPAVGDFANRFDPSRAEEKLTPADGAPRRSAGGLGPKSSRETSLGQEVLATMVQGGNSEALLSARASLQRKADSPASSSSPAIAREKSNEETDSLSPAIVTSGLPRALDDRRKTATGTMGRALPRPRTAVAGARTTRSEPGQAGAMADLPSLAEVASRDSGQEADGEPARQGVKAAESESNARSRTDRAGALARRSSEAWEAPARDGLGSNASADNSGAPPIAGRSGIHQPTRDSQEGVAAPVRAPTATRDNSSQIVRAPAGVIRFPAESPEFIPQTTQPGERGPLEDFAASGPGRRLARSQRGGDDAPAARRADSARDDAPGGRLVELTPGTLAAPAHGEGARAAGPLRAASPTQRSASTNAVVQEDLAQAAEVREGDATNDKAPRLGGRSDEFARSSSLGSEPATRPSLARDDMPGDGITAEAPKPSPAPLERPGKRAQASAEPSRGGESGLGRTTRAVSAAATVRIEGLLSHAGDDVAAGPPATAGASQGPSSGLQRDARAQAPANFQRAVSHDVSMAAGGLGERPAVELGLPLRIARRDGESLAPVPSRFLDLPPREASPLPRKRARTAAYQGRDRARHAVVNGSADHVVISTERAIEQGLVFLAKVQASDGHWSLHDYDPRRARDSRETSSLRSDTGATSLALLAFLGAGYDHYEPKYQQVVARGLEYLRKHQKQNGDLFVPMDGRSNQSAWLYSHAMAAMALSEAYGMTGDESLRDPAQRAVDFILRAQEPRLGGWRYAPGRESDTSVTGWMLMALKSAELAGLNVDPVAYDRIRDWLARAQGEAPWQYVYNPHNTVERGRQPSATMNAVGLLMRLYLGWDREHPAMREGGIFLSQNPPRVGTRARPLRDTYYWYYGTLVMFHMGGEYWKAWHEALHPLLVNSQVEAGEYAGSWNPLGPIMDRWGPHAGRIYVTTMNLLSLEVSYRHLPLYESTGR